MSRPRVSLCMIVRDEAGRLPACLGSAARAVDEAIVVDTGSTDGTPEVARAHGARVVPFAWRDDFAAARNELLRHATGDWILVLDADERLAPGGADLVRAAAADASADGRDCRIVSALPAGQPAPAITSRYCRLFRRAPGVRFEGRIHEQVAPSILGRGGRIAPSDITILHEGYRETRPDKLRRNLRLLEQALAERPGEAFALLNLGLTRQALGDREAALCALAAAVASDIAPLSRALRAVGLAHLAEACLTLGRWDEATRASTRALEEEPRLHLARYVLGRCLFEAGDFDAAAGAFAAIDGAGPDVLGMVIHPYLRALGLGLCHLRRRRFAEAAAALEPVAADDPSGEALFHLGNARLGLGDLAGAAHAYGRARAAGFDHPDLDRRHALCRRLETSPGAPVTGGGTR